MKKTLSVVLAFLLILSFSSVVFAASPSAEVFVTIADSSGKLTVAHKSITVTDTNNDGLLTITDALYCAHESFYNGGASAGYATAVTVYGLGITKLWGETNNGSFGYYVNNQSAWSLMDKVTDNDSVYAFCYQDAKGFSDHYSYFQSETVSCTAFDTVQLSLLCNTYDANFNIVTTPVVGAAITVDGNKTGVVTDADGKASIVLTSSGDHVISALSPDSGKITPPICKATVANADLTKALTYYFNQIVLMFKQLLSILHK